MVWDPKPCTVPLQTPGPSPPFSERELGFTSRHVLSSWPTTGQAAITAQSVVGVSGLLMNTALTRRCAEQPESTPADPARVGELPTNRQRLAHLISGFAKRSTSGSDTLIVDGFSWPHSYLSTRWFQIMYTSTLQDTSLIGTRKTMRCVCLLTARGTAENNE